MGKPIEPEQPLLPPGLSEAWSAMLQVGALRQELVALRSETTSMAEAYRDMARAFESSDQLSHNMQQRTLGMLSRVLQAADRVEKSLQRIEEALADLPDNLRGILEPYLLPHELLQVQKECLVLARLLAGRGPDGSLQEGAVSPLTEVLRHARSQAGLDPDTGKKRQVVDWMSREIGSALLKGLWAALAAALLLWGARLVLGHPVISFSSEQQGGQQGPHA